MLRSRSSIQVELDILDTCSLGSRPMDAGNSRARSDSSRIDDQITDLSVKDVGATPILVLRVVGVSIDEKSTKTTGCLNSGKIIRITNNHAIVGYIER